MSQNIIYESLLNKCLTILKRDDVKDELKNMFVPLINLLLVEIYPYIYLSMLFVIISFLLHLGIFFLLLRNKNFSKDD
jgi:hypothetical protein